MAWGDIKLFWLWDNRRTHWKWSGSGSVLTCQRKPQLRYQSRWCSYGSQPAPSGDGSSGSSSSRSSWSRSQFCLWSSSHADQFDFSGKLRWKAIVISKKEPSWFTSKVVSIELQLDLVPVISSGNFPNQRQNSPVSAALYDTLLAVSPIFLLWNVQMDIYKKMMLCGLLALGFLCVIFGQNYTSSFWNWWRKQYHYCWYHQNHVHTSINRDRGSDLLVFLILQTSETLSLPWLV